MEAKELMIGDLIRYTQDQCLTDEDKAPLTVTCVGEPEYPDYMPFIKYKGSNEKYHQDLFEPIPLTAEILAKNFEVGYNPSPYYSLNKRCKIEKDYLKGGYVIEVITKWVDITLCKIKYVHQLQHALRLVGLNEMADSIKVE